MDMTQIQEIKIKILNNLIEATVSSKNELDTIDKDDADMIRSKSITHNFFLEKSKELFDILFTDEFNYIEIPSIERQYNHNHFEGARYFQEIDKKTNKPSTLIVTLK